MFPFKIFKKINFILKLKILTQIKTRITWNSPRIPTVVAATADPL